MDEFSLTTRGLTKCFGDFKAVDNLDLELRQGEILALLGPSGCGKTTTLRMIAGLERPSGGEIVFKGQTLVSVADRTYLPPEKRNVGMVFQSYALWPHMTVFENISYPLRLRRMKAAVIRSHVLSVLELMGLQELMDQTIPHLSGGQQQRVALARALVYEPALILFDEPFSNLDAQLRAQMRLELKALRRKVSMTGIFVTHDQVEALSLADRVAIMRGGRVEQAGSPMEVYKNPATRFVRDFLGKVVNLQGIVEAIDPSGLVRIGLHGDSKRTLNATKPGDVRVKAGDRAEISIRPEYIRIHPDGGAEGAANIITGSVMDLLFTGSCFEARIEVGEERILLELPTDGGWREGQTLGLEFQEDAISLWPERASPT